MSSNHEIQMKKLKALRAAGMEPDEQETRLAELEALGGERGVSVGKLLSLTDRVTELEAELKDAKRDAKWYRQNYEVLRFDNAPVKESGGDCPSCGSTWFHSPDMRRVGAFKECKSCGQKYTVTPVPRPPPRLEIARREAHRLAAQARAAARRILRGEEL